MVYVCGFRFLRVVCLRCFAVVILGDCIRCFDVYCLDVGLLILV